MSDDMNLLELPLDRLMEEIQYNIEDGEYSPVLILGKSGVGKTEAIYNLTKKMGIGFCEMRLVTMTETDIMGVPQINEFGATEFAANSLLPRAERDGEVGILVLDEITSASRTVRAAAYQLLDSKRSIGNYKLPEKWMICCLGNGPDDGGVFNGIESAVLSRCTCYRVEPDVNAWKKWAVPNGIHPTVLGFISMRPELIHKFNPDEMAAVFPCPRSWAALSRKITAREKRKGGMLDGESVEIYAAGAVGAEVSPQFSQFYSYKKEAIDTMSIIEGVEQQTDISNYKAETIQIVIQSLISQVCKMASGKILEPGVPEYDKCMNVIRWALYVGQQRVDYALQTLQDLCTGCQEFKEMVVLDYDGDIEKRCPGWQQFIDRTSMIVA